MWRLGRFHICQCGFSPLPSGAPPDTRKLSADLIPDLEDLLKCGLNPSEKHAFFHFSFSPLRTLLRAKRLDAAAAWEWKKKISALITTSAKQQIISTEGVYFDGLLSGTEGRGRPADLYTVVLPEGLVCVAKVYSVEARHTALAEASISSLFHSEAPVPARRHLVRVLRVLHVDSPTSGRIALILPWFVRSLRDLCNDVRTDRQLPTAFIRRVVRGLATALLALHDLGWSHCDVKYDNVMVDGDGEPCLIDLGSATRHGFDMRECLPPAFSLGFEGASSPVMDLHGFASLLWVLTTGIPPPVGSPGALLRLAEREGSTPDVGDSARLCYSVVATLLAEEGGALGRVLALVS